MRYFLVLLMMLPLISLSAQLDILFENSKPIDEKRYKDIKDDCMLFDNWINACLYDIKGLKFNNIPINYNGESHFLEAKKNEKEFIDVNVKQVPRAVVYDVEATGMKDLAFMDSLVLINVPRLQTNSTFHILLYKDLDKLLYLEFYAALNSVTDQIPGETVVRERFNKKYNLVLINDNGVSKFPVTQKKKIAKEFEDYGDYIKWCKSNKMKPNQYESLVKFLNANP